MARILSAFLLWTITTPSLPPRIQPSPTYLLHSLHSPSLTRTVSVNQSKHVHNDTWVLNQSCLGLTLIFSPRNYSDINTISSSFLLEVPILDDFTVSSFPINPFIAPKSGTDILLFLALNMFHKGGENISSLTNSISPCHGMLDLYEDGF